MLCASEAAQKVVSCNVQNKSLDTGVLFEKCREAFKFTAALMSIKVNGWHQQKGGSMSCKSLEQRLCARHLLCLLHAEVTPQNAHSESGIQRASNIVAYS